MVTYFSFQEKQSPRTCAQQPNHSFCCRISNGPSSNSYWVGWAHYTSIIPPTEIDLKVVAAGPTA